MDAYQTIRNKVRITKRIYDFRLMVDSLPFDMRRHCFNTSREFLEQWHIYQTEGYNDMLKYHENVRKLDDAQFYRLMAYWPTGDCPGIETDASWTTLADEFHGSPALQALLSAWLGPSTYT
jgi:hypothetical protein